jgi:hypothetical protein
VAATLAFYASPAAAALVLALGAVEKARGLWAVGPHLRAVIRRASGGETHPSSQ